MRAAPRLCVFRRLLFLPVSVLRRACFLPLLLRLAPVRCLAEDPNSAASRALIPLRPLFSLPPPKNLSLRRTVIPAPGLPKLPAALHPALLRASPVRQKKDPLSEKNGSLS